MQICKNLKIDDTITTLDEWKKKCPPKGKDKQWKDFRSAKENAKYWIENNYKDTALYKNLLKDLNENIVFNICSPEYELKFDSYRNSRQADLLILGNYNNKNIAIGIEAKADETYDAYIYNKIIKSSLTILEKPKSNQLNRILELKEKLFTSNKFYFLRYQLIVGTMGLINYAIENKIDTIVFYSLTFSSNETKLKKLKKNKEDFDNILEYFNSKKLGNFNEANLPSKLNFSGRLLFGSEEVILPETK